MTDYKNAGSRTLFQLADQHGNVVIACWPYAESNQSEDNAAENAAKGVKNTVFLFGCIWLAIAIWALIDCTRYAGGGYIYVQAAKYLLLGLIPLFALTKGITHIHLNSYGIGFEKRVPGIRGAELKIPWQAVKKIYLIKTGEKDPRRYTLCFKDVHGPVHKIRLSKIATGENWKKLLAAIEAWSPVKPDNLDEFLFDSLSPNRADPTYTTIWLDALSAPPHRERLTPLKEGMTLKHGTYTLVRILGSGGQGTAYLAVVDSKNVVLKEYILPVYVDIKVRKQAIERFQHEAMMLAQLDHPAIVKLLDSFVDDHRAYLVLEYIDGKSLKNLVDSEGPQSNERVAQLGIMMCDILTYLHSQAPPVVHRDFTPDNLILNSDGSLKLIDFMIAQQVEDSATASVVGKHSYLSPEQFQGKATTQSDIYGLGATLCFLLTGLNPEPISCSHPIVDCDQVDPVLDEIVSKCTEAAFVSRYVNAIALKRELEQYLQNKKQELSLSAEAF